MKLWLYSLLAGLLCLSGFAVAQDSDSSSTDTAQGQPLIIFRDAPRPRRFAAEEVQAAGTGLPAWSGSFKYKGTVYKYVMIGSDPAKGSKTTTVPVFIVPLKLTYYDGAISMLQRL